MVVLFLIFFWGTSILLPGVAEQMYIRTSGTQVFSVRCHQHLPLVFLVTILTGVKCYFIIVLICVFLKSDVEQLPCACWPFVHFFGKMSMYILCPDCNWIVFVLLSCMDSLCILDMNPVSDMICIHFLSLKWVAFSFFLLLLPLFLLLCRNFLVCHSLICLFSLLLPLLLVSDPKHHH